MALLLVEWRPLVFASLMMALRKSVKHQKNIFGFVHFSPDSTEECEQSEDLLVDILKFYDVPVKHCHKLPFYPCIVLTLSLSYHHICPDQWVPPSFENEIIFQHLMIKDKFFVSDKNICSVAY